MSIGKLRARPGSRLPVPHRQNDNFAANINHDVYTVIRKHFDSARSSFSHDISLPLSYLRNSMETTPPERSCTEDIAKARFAPPMFLFSSPSLCIRIFLKTSNEFPSIPLVTLPCCDAPLSLSRDECLFYFVPSRCVYLPIRLSLFRLSYRSARRANRPRRSGSARARSPSRFPVPPRLPFRRATEQLRLVRNRNCPEPTRF